MLLLIVPEKAQQDWNTVVGTAKTTVDNFFSSLYSGDWTVFENGILNAIGLAKRYTEALSNAKMAMAIGESKADRLEAERNNYEYLITRRVLVMKKEQQPITLT